MAQLSHVLPVIGEGKLEDRRLHSIVSPLNDVPLTIYETVDVDDLDVEVELGDQVFSHPGLGELSRIVEDYLSVLGLPFLCGNSSTFVRYILVWAEKYS